MTQKASKRSIVNRTQIQKAIDLRSTGASYDGIGRGMGISKTRAYQLVMIGIADLDEGLKESADRLRTLELLRLDAIAHAHWEKRDNPRNADVILKVMERRAKLLGLDAPTKVAQTTPDGEALPPALDLSRLTDAELTELDRLYSKMLGEPESPANGPKYVCCSVNPQTRAHEAERPGASHSALDKSTGFFGVKVAV